jgi:hypothetical protein
LKPNPFSLYPASLPVRNSTVDYDTIGKRKGSATFIVVKGIKRVVSLEKATLEQIVSELQSRRNLTFALVVLIASSESESGIFASPDCDVFDVVRILIAGAQDIMECLANDLDAGEPKGKPSSTSALGGAPILRTPRGRIQKDNNSRS